MKRKISILMSIVMVFTMCAMFTGCGKDSEGSGKKSDKELIIGDWECEIDITDMMKDAFLSADGMDEYAEYFDIKNLSFKMSMNFDEDGTCTMELDKASMEKCIDDLMDQALDGMVVMMEDMMNMSLADMAAQSNMSEADFKAQLETTLKKKAGLGNDLFGELELEGETEYEIKDGKIYLGEEETMTYELSKNKLTITEIDAESGSDFDLSDFLPLEFTRK